MLLQEKIWRILHRVFSAKLVLLSSEKRLITSIYDITERKHLQDLINRERNLLRTLLDNLPDPVSVRDIGGKYLLNNKAHIQILGAETQDEVIGKTAFDFFPEKDAESYHEEDQNVFKKGKMILDKI